MPCIREPLRAARAVPLFHFWGEVCLRTEGRGTRTAIPLITILNSLSFLHLGSGGGAYGSESQFLNMHFLKSVKLCKILYIVVETSNAYYILTNGVK